MSISALNSIGNVYAKKSFGAVMTKEAALRDFNALLSSNNVIINAQLKPNSKGTYTISKLELAKEDPCGYHSNTVPVTDNNGIEAYTVSSEGKSINDALLNMMKAYAGQALYCSKNGSSPIFCVPNYRI